MPTSCTSGPQVELVAAAVGDSSKMASMFEKDSRGSSLPSGSPGPEMESAVKVEGEAGKSQGVTEFRYQRSSYFSPSFGSKQTF